MDAPNRCCKKIAEERKPYKIIFFKNEIYHDIDDDTRQLQVIRKLIDVPVSTDERHRYIIDRYIDRAINHIATRLTAYIATDKPHIIVNNHTKPWEEHNIYLAMPIAWSPDNLQHLCEVAHLFVVRKTEAELLSLYIGPNDPLVRQYRIDAEEAENEIVSIVNQRIGTMTAPFTPFG